MLEFSREVWKMFLSLSAALILLGIVPLILHGGDVVFLIIDGFLAFLFLAIGIFAFIYDRKGTWRKNH